MSMFFKICNAHFFVHIVKKTYKAVKTFDFRPNFK